MRIRAWHAMLIVGVVVARAASAADGALDRSGDAAFLLGVASPETVKRVRGNCVAGGEPGHIATLRQARVTDLPDIVDECVAALTRLGRDGTLGYVRDRRSDAITPARAFDSGFVEAYQKHEPIPANLPTMEAVKPVAARCLSQAERDTDLCASAGYAFGVRAAQGQTMAER